MADRTYDDAGNLKLSPRWRSQSVSRMMEEVEDLYLCAVLSPCWQGKEPRRFPDINRRTPQHIICTQETVIDPAFQYRFADENQGLSALDMTFLTWLRLTILQGGGFSGWVGRPEAKKLVEKLTDGLQPF